jgi:predicted ATPase
MLTRLKVDGFKNLDGVDVRLGPFTCIAGPNGVGKSNLFDAVAFLSALAEKPLMEAPLDVRAGDALSGDVTNLFQRVGDHVSEEMRFLVEFLIPEKGVDALGQQATASMTFLRYELVLRLRRDDAIYARGTLEIVHESMVHINRSSAKSNLAFPHKKVWRDSVVKGRRTSPYISTEVGPGGVAIVALHADSPGGQGGGRPRKVAAAGLARTMLSYVSSAAEHRTLVIARQEMMRWTQLQLEPSPLRAPDRFSAPRTIAANGAHLPATLYSLAQDAERAAPGGRVDLYARVAMRLSELVENVRRVKVEVDERRQLLSIVMTDHHHTEHVASALSDGTLRFLALTVMEADPRTHGLLCLEEPENGIHPLRIPAIIELLSDLAVDTSLPVDTDNPLRQVVINTHSPSVVAYVGDEALLVAQAVRAVRGELEASRLTIRPLAGTWRQVGPDQAVSRGELLVYLNPFAVLTKEPHQNETTATRKMPQRDVRQLDLNDLSQQAPEP